MAAYVREGDGASALPLPPREVGTWVPEGSSRWTPNSSPACTSWVFPMMRWPPGRRTSWSFFDPKGATVDPARSSCGLRPSRRELHRDARSRDGRRHEFLRRALPRMTEKELALGAKLEAQLTSSSRTSPAERTASAPPAPPCTTPLLRPAVGNDRRPDLVYARATRVKGRRAERVCPTMLPRTRGLRREGEAPGDRARARLKDRWVSGSLSEVDPDSAARRVRVPRAGRCPVTTGPATRSCF